VSSKERIGKLEQLLARVKERAASRTPSRSAAGAVGTRPAIPHDDVAAEPPAFAMASAAPLPAPEELPVAAQTAPPPAPEYDASADAADAAYADGADMDADVEVSSEVVEVDIDIDEPGAPEPLAAESGAQPVAHPTMPPEDLDEDLDQPANTQPSQRPDAIGEEIAAAAPPLANEIEEPAPSSSRRPIAADEADAYAEESAPRHTPPPESGKQVAAPSVSPAASRKSSVPPPPSLEGHTLIGGWREPGLPSVNAGAATGVRVPAPSSGLEHAPTELVSAAPAPQPSGTRLSPDVTRPEMPEAANVASFAGAPPVPRPSTLGELLDLSLGL